MRRGRTTLELMQWASRSQSNRHVHLELAVESTLHPDQGLLPSQTHHPPPRTDPARYQRFGRISRQDRRNCTRQVEPRPREGSEPEPEPEPAGLLVTRLPSPQKLPRQTDIQLRTGMQEVGSTARSRASEPPRPQSQLLWSRKNKTTRAPILAKGPPLQALRGTFAWLF